MRNLKKILALALALVMTLSLMTVANAFNDDKDIDANYAEAVTVLSGLGVFKGVNDGSNFAPKQTITRGEVAAIIYRIVTGDVTDTQASIYKDYAKFADVAENHWAAGYIGYCSNAELIVGDGTNFYPDQTVTGYQALAMILRALGYDQNDEFKGEGWEIRTASTAQQKGVLKNINAGTLGTGASREMVAEILFQAIANTNMVYYLTNTMSYQDAGSTLGYKTFKLERIEGEITANEYADLYSGAALPAGKTELDGRVIDIATEITDIGESRYAYVTGSKVLTMADTGLNKVFETGAATKVDDRSTGMKLAGAEDFVNFNDADDDNYEADIRIVYSITGYDADKVSIKAGEKLTTKEYEDIRSIFYGETNYTNGWVIVGTTYQGESQAVADDVSNDMTFRAFVREYLVNDSKDIIVVDSTENGEWLKVIDNDGDGAAEYIFKTEFAMAEIDNITSKGVYTFTELADIDAPQLVPDTADDLDVDGKDIVTGDELAEGDIVLYTLIDGKYYVDIATMVTGTVDKKGINSKDETISVDGTVYTQSHIGYSDAPDTSYNYYSDVTEGHTEETYDLYLDHFGYVRLFAESAYNRGFVLLTDGYYWTDNRTEDFQATIYDLDADELVDVDVSDKGASRFIETDEGHTGDRGTWGRLEKVDDVYKTPAFTKANQYVTNIAAYAEADGVYTLADAENASNRENYWVHEVDTNGIKLNERNLTSLTRDDLFGDRRIQTVTTTQYYLVVRENDANGNASSKIVDILTWTGYKNAPAEAELGSDTVAYAVAHTSDSYAYAVADVVVFETNTTADKDTYFVYETNNWRTEYVWGIGYDADDKIVDDRVYVEVNAVPAEIEFYEITEKGGMSIIDDDYADHNIYAGYVDVIDDTTKYDYFQVGNTAAGDLYFSPEEGSDEYAPLFQVYVNRLGDYDVELVDDWADIHLGTGMILFTDNKGNVEYAIYVGDVMSLYDVEDAPLAAVEDLFWAIVRDAAYVPTDFEAAMAKAEAAIVTGTIEALTEAKKALEDLYTVKADGSIVTNLTNEEYNHVKGMLAKVEAELAPLVADKELAEAKTAALAKIEEKKGEWTQGMIDAAKAAVDAAKTEADLDWASKITARAGEIQNAQNVAKAAVDSKVTGLTQTNYNAAEWSAILNIQTQAKADIDKASTDEAITAIQNKAIADIEAVKTAAVVEGEKLLNNAKEAIEAALEDGSLKVSDATLAAATGIEGKVNDALSSASVTGVTVKVEGVQNYASSVTCTVTLSLTTPVIGVGNVVMNNVTINEGV